MRQRQTRTLRANVEALPEALVAFGLIVAMVGSIHRCVFGEVLLFARGNGRTVYEDCLW